MAIEIHRGIVLASTAMGEADLCVKLLTKEAGKISLIFRGIRKSKKRSKAGLDPGSVLEVQYYSHQNQELYSVKEYDIIEYNEGFRSNLELIMSLHYILEIVEKTSAPHDPHPEVFTLLVGALHSLKSTKFHIHLITFTLIHLLLNQGLLRREMECDSCTTFLEHDMWIQPGTSSLLCRKCQNGNDMILSEKGVLFLKYSLTKKFNQIPSVDIPKDSVKEILYLFTQAVESHLGISIKSTPLVLES